MTTRRTVRAILIDDEQRLVLLRRVRPGQSPYWVTPGGGIEASDPDPESALHRELLEELGATIEIRFSVTLTDTGGGAGATDDLFYVARLTSIDATRRTGEEFRDASRGTYEVERLDPAGSDLTSLDLRPVTLKRFVIDNAAALIAETATGR